LGLKSAACQKRRLAEPLRRNAGIPGPEGPVDNPKHDDRTIDGWRLEQRFPLDLDDSSVVEQAPPLWKDLTLASVIALLLWVAAVATFR
jgi:hypothetical protein